jgi:glutathione synthase/RimK-type ligase-like ATP-grasp enzyme
MQRQLLPVDDDESWTPDRPGHGVTLGVVREFSGSHRHYVAACRDLGVACRVLDLSGSGWIDVVRDSGCDAFLVRPEYLVRAWKERQDDRIRIMADELGLLISPSPKELWLYESKERAAHWLAANAVRRPKTWVFSSEERALEFVRSAELPIVWKLDFGSGASGVRILRDRRELLRAVRRSFRRGVRLPGAHPLDRQWGSVIFQEYLPDVREWRSIRVGRSFFAFEKLKKGDFHSGSGQWNFDDPPLELIDFAKEFTDKAGFTSMSIDIFETPEGEFLVNEMHTFFASPSPHKTKVGGHPGRYVYDEGTGGWRFEEGTFFENAGCNLRVEALLEMLERRET